MVTIEKAEKIFPAFFFVADFDFSLELFVRSQRHGTMTITKELNKGDKNVQAHNSKQRHMVARR